MKSLRLLFALGALAIALPAAASTQSVVFDGSNLSPQLSLSTVESHVVYETREVPSTCYRDEFIGYRTECDTVWRRQCRDRRICREVRPGHRRCHVEPECTSFPERVCRQIPEYRQVSYSCSKFETVPVRTEVDFNVRAEVSVNFSQVPAGVTPAEQLQVALDGEQVSLSAAAVSNRVLMFVQKNSSVQVVKPDLGADAPGEKLVTASFNVTLVDAQLLNTGLSEGLAELTLSGSVLSFTVAEIPTTDFLEVRFSKFEHDKFGSNKDLFAGVIPAWAVKVRSLGNGRSEISIDTARLPFAETVKSGREYKMSFTVSARANGIAGSLLNPGTVLRPLEIVDRKLKSL
jgi:hypothetical protein